MCNVLIYFPYNQRTVEQQSVMELLVKKGHSVFLLTLSPKGYLHDYVKKIGVYASASPVPESNSFLSIFRNAKYLLQFCSRHNIDVIFSHQQLCMLPLIFARPLLKTKNYYFRHNTDEDYHSNSLKAGILNRGINFFTRNFIAPSDVVYDYLVNSEKVNPNKIRRINYGYNFNQYDKPNLRVAKEIRKQYQCDLLLVSIARLVPAKRHEYMFEVINQLVKKGINIKMICLGDGMIKKKLLTWIVENNLSDNIYLLGNKNNIFDYLAAADILLHLSETEASNSVVKEAGLIGKVVIACNEVGDFSDYIVNGVNGFLTAKDYPIDKSVSLIESLNKNRLSLSEIGNALKKTVIVKFSIENVSPLYDDLLKS